MEKDIVFLPERHGLPVDVPVDGTPLKPISCASQQQIRNLRASERGPFRRGEDGVLRSIRSDRCVFGKNNQFKHKAPQDLCVSLSYRHVWPLQLLPGMWPLLRTLSLQCLKSLA